MVAKQVVLVTGASRGIGRAIAHKFAERGYRVGIHFHTNRAAAESCCASLPGGDHVILQANLTNPLEVDKLHRDALEAFGRLDVLINNAGIYEEHPVTETDLDSWRRIWRETLNTNLVSPADLTFLAVHSMLKQGGGRVVNVSSRGAFRGEPTAPAYGASKAGLNAFSQSLARHLAPRGVYVFVVAPGWVETEMAAAHLQGEQAADILSQHPLGRVATAEEVATAVAFLGCDAPASMTGCIIDVNGASYLRT